MLGIGIDEDTAIVVTDEEQFTVLGSGAVYIVDGREITASNVAEECQDMTLSVSDVRLHVLSAGSPFDLVARRPGERPHGRERHCVARAEESADRT